MESTGGTEQTPPATQDNGNTTQQPATGQDNSQ